MYVRRLVLVRIDYVQGICHAHHHQHGTSRRSASDYYYNYTVLLLVLRSLDRLGLYYSGILILSPTSDPERTKKPKDTEQGDLFGWWWVPNQWLWSRHLTGWTLVVWYSGTQQTQQSFFDLCPGKGKWYPASQLTCWAGSGWTSRPSLMEWLSNYWYYSFRTLYLERDTKISFPFFGRVGKASDANQNPGFFFFILDSIAYTPVAIVAVCILHLA